MAINKDQDVDGGYSAGYWYLTGWSMDRATQMFHGTFKLYKSKADREAGASAVGQVQAKTPFAGMSQTNGEIRDGLVADAKATVLSGGTDTAD